MRRPRLFGLPLLVFALLWPEEGSAQWTAPRGWHRVSLGVGPAEALSRVAPLSREGVALLAAFELVALEHLEVRFSGTGFKRSGTEEMQLGGVAVDGVVFPWRGRVQPYVGGGIGVYQLIVTDRSPTAVESRLDHQGAAWTALVGTRVRIGPVTPFVEWRRTEFAADAPGRRYEPILVGLHL